MLLREIRFISACTIGLLRIKRFRPEIGLLEVVAVSVYQVHTLNTVLHSHSTVSLCRGSLFQ